MIHIVKNLYQNLVQISSTDVTKAIESKEDIVVKLEGTDLRMLLSPVLLASPITKSEILFKDVFDTVGYNLYSYKWQPNDLLTPQEEARRNMLGEGWFDILKDQFEKDYLVNLSFSVARMRQIMNIYPDKQDTFKAYKLTQPNEVKVVILSQEPYSYKAADGLAFSSKETKLPAALKLIYDAIEEDIKFGLYLDQNPDLTYWANQGVFLLNSILTVTAGQPKSHEHLGWQKFTGASISRLSKRYDNIVFLLWGVMAGRYEHYIDKTKNHLIIRTEHPTKAYYDKRTWDYQNCFSEANAFLKQVGKEPINW